MASAWRNGVMAITQWQHQHLAAAIESGGAAAACRHQRRHNVSMYGGIRMAASPAAHQHGISWRHQQQWRNGVASALMAAA